MMLSMKELKSKCNGRITPIYFLQPFSKDYNLVSLTTYVVCINLIYEWQNLQFTVDSKR